LRKPPSSDFAVYDQVYILNEYQPLVDLIKKNEHENRRSLNIIDAGGNIGLTSIFFNNIFKDSRFIIVEPDKDNFNILEDNIRQNEFIGSKLVKAGVWSKCTYLTANRDFRDGNDWSVSVRESDIPSDIKGYSIPALMDLLDFKLIDILKIDIEGSEKQLFNDENLATEFLSKTKYIAIEIHDEFDCRDQINKCLILNNFEFFLKDGLTIGVNRNLVA
jgi:FkbM family methyltransferase